MLGGQNGEEGKVEDEGICEEACEEDEAENLQEEEVGSTLASTRSPSTEGRLAQVGEVAKRSAMQPRTSRRFKSTTEGVGEIEVTLRRSAREPALRVGVML
jgi:hypothetical protein